jgi:DNA modification methylase
MCGESTNAEDVARLMGGEKADMVFTDPPYNVAIGDKNKAINDNRAERGLSRTNAIESNIENDNFKTDEECGEKLWKPAFTNLFENAKDSCPIYVTMPQGGTHMMMMMMMRDSGWQVKHELIWVKNSPTFSMGRLNYDYQHEPILYGWKKTHKWVGKGKFNKSIWEIDKPKKCDLHPTMKPIELIENALLNSSEKNDLILDLFGGSGSTLIACEKNNRKARLMELDPHYCDVIRRRYTQWAKENGKPLTSGCLNEDGTSPLN